MAPIENGMWVQERAWDFLPTLTATNNAINRDREIAQESKETPRETTSRYIGLWIKGWERFFPKIVDRILRGE